MLEQMIERCQSEDAIALGIELAEMAIEEGKKSVIHFEELAKEHSKDAILVPHWIRLDNVIEGWKSSIKFHEDLKYGLQQKQALKV